MMAKRYEPRHARDKQCTYRWNTRPTGSKEIPGAHYDHTCVNQPRNGSQCGGPHACRTWDCHEIHS